jgi:alpha-tubulin suppressor-like RCC1 family protein
MDPNVIKLAMGAGGPSGPDYKLFAWGYGYSGQLGLNSQTDRSSPVQVGSLTDWSSIFCGSKNSFSVKKDGTLWAWGRNNNGQLGIGTGGGDVNNKSSPVQVGGLTTWSSVSASQYHTLAIKTDGTLWAWGKNYSGQLGIGTSLAGSDKSSPVQVGSLTTWSKVSASGNSSLAIKTDGTLWSWGYNGKGELGLGDTTNRSSPTQVGALTNWSSVSIGGNFTLAVKTNGTVWTWGFNGFGGLGLGNTTNQSSPVQVGSLTTWSSIASGGNHVMAIKTDGTLWAWGFNAKGQLGLGNITNRSSPVQVGSLNKWYAASCGVQHSMVISN